MNITSIMRRIASLTEKTTENGCTEAEALGAAEKVASMLAEHGLSLSDIEIKERKDCEEGVIDTGRKRSHPIVFAMTEIAAFCDVKVWRSRQRGRATHYVFFGFPEDVAAAKGMYNMLLNAMDCAVLEYKRERFHFGEPTGRSQSSSFLKGMASRLGERLDEMKAEQDRDNRETTGRDLVVVKGAVVEDAYKKLNMKMSNRVSQSTYGDGAAFAAGGKAGDRVGFNKGVTGASQRVLAS